MDINLDAETVLTAVSGIGAANYASAEFLSFDLMSEFFANSPEIGAIVFGAAGVVMVTEKFEVTEIID